MMKVISYDSERDGKLLTLEECAAFFKCSVDQMRQIVEAGDLPVVIVPNVNRKR